MVLIYFTNVFTLHERSGGRQSIYKISSNRGLALKLGRGETEGKAYYDILMTNKHISPQILMTEVQKKKPFCYYNPKKNILSSICT